MPAKREKVVSIDLPPIYVKFSKRKNEIEEGTLSGEFKHKALPWDTKVNRKRWEAEDAHEVIGPLGFYGDHWVADAFNHWGYSAGGSGGASRVLRDSNASTGTDPSSNAYIDVSWRSLNGQQGNYDKDCTIEWLVWRTGSDSECWALYKQCHSPTMANLSDKGFGFKVANFALYGIVYDTSYHEINLRTTLVAGTVYRLKLVFKAGSKLEWYVDDVLKGSTTVYLPSGTTTNHFVMAAGIANGATGGVNALAGIVRVEYWREW